MTKAADKLLIEYREQQKELADNGPAERWRKPVIPIAVENDTSEMTHDGVDWRAGYNATFDAETVERFRVGRVCLTCWEPQQEAFPEHCSLCRYPMRDRQPHDFAKQYEGEKWVGPTTSLQDEYDRMIENGQRKRHTPGSTILLPGRDF